MLCTSYNRAILDRNPSVDEVFAYRKRNHGASPLAVIYGSLQKVALIAKLRSRRFDVAIAASSPSSKRVNRLVGLINPSRFLRSDAFGDEPGSVESIRLEAMNEVERVWEIGRGFGLVGEPGELQMFPEPESKRMRRARFQETTARTNLAAIHISSRKPSQQWSAECFADVIRSLAHAHATLGFVILWAPGDSEARGHSGDDAKKEELAGCLGTKMPVTFHETPDLEATVSAISACDYFLGSDGGAMHIAAGCGLAVVGLFGGSDLQRWRPWRARSEALQTAAKNVSDLTSSVVAEAATSVWFG